MLAGLRGEGQGFGESTPFLLFSLQKLFPLLTVCWFASILLAEDSQPVNIWFSVAVVPHTPDVSGSEQRRRVLVDLAGPLALPSS